MRISTRICTPLILLEIFQIAYLLWLSRKVAVEFAFFKCFNMHCYSCRSQRKADPCIMMHVECVPSNNHSASMVFSKSVCREVRGVDNSLSACAFLLLVCWGLFVIILSSERTCWAGAIVLSPRSVSFHVAIKFNQPQHSGRSLESIHSSVVAVFCDWDTWSC